MSAYPSRIVCLTEETTETLYLLGEGDRIVGVSGYTGADALASKLEHGLDAIREGAAHWTMKPRVYFEEWDDPLISGIQWVEELVEIAGGVPIFPELREKKLGKDRIVAAEDVIARQPDVIVASWCGKAVRVPKIAGRPGWAKIPAVRDGHIYEIKSSYILQPGPAALTDGVRRLHDVLTRAIAIDGPLTRRPLH